MTDEQLFGLLLCVICVFAFIGVVAVVAAIFHDDAPAPAKEQAEKQLSMRGDSQRSSSARSETVAADRMCKDCGKSFWWSVSNQEYFASGVRVDRDVDTDRELLLYDPQTSGGLLVAARADAAPLVEAALRGAQVAVSRIGTVESAAPGVHIVVRM